MVLCALTRVPSTPLIQEISPYITITIIIIILLCYQ